MIEKILSKNEFNDWLKELQKSFELIGPKTKGDQIDFAPLEDSAPELSFQNSRLSPKGLVQPASEKMFQFTANPENSEAHILQEILRETGSRLVVGIRPCDARAYQLVQLNFVTSDIVDPWWKQGRERLTLMGLGCSKPCSTCFCTSVGGGPFDNNGLDLLMVDLGTDYLIQSCTEKGEALLTAGPGKMSTEEDQNKAAQLKAEAEKMITSRVSTDHLKDQPLLDLFNAPFWDEVQFACINCGTCTYLCPTCWCFDIQDEVHGLEGIRMRNWDSCMYPLFTLHGSGHNPRGEKVQRVRQRFMHKLKYYVNKYDNGVACVGCGRCVQFCPVNIDIRRVCQLMNDYKAN